MDVDDQGEFDVLGGRLERISYAWNEDRELKRLIGSNHVAPFPSF